jgi:hypothetical protein
MDRKQIIKALEEHTGVKAKYMGVPSFAYQITINGRTYTIDRAGRITLDDVEVELEALINGMNEDKEISAREQQQENEVLDLKITIPMEGHTGSTLRNLLNMLYSKQTILKKVFEIEYDILEADFIEGLNKANIQTIEEFKTEIAGKQESGYHGFEFDFTNNTITFKFFKHLQEPDRLEAYTQFISLLSQSARGLKHASPKPTATDNYKFTMRTWLIRLGFVGREYKKSRMLLLQNLEGDGAYRRNNKACEVTDI